MIGRSRSRTSMSKAIMGWVLAVLWAPQALSTTAAPPPCMREPAHPGAVDLLLQIYHEESPKRQQIAVVIADMIAKELVVPAKHRDATASLVRSIVPSVLPQARSAEALNAQLAETLGPLCTILIDTNEAKEPAAGLQASNSPPDNVAASRRKGSPPPSSPPPGAPTPLKLEDPISKALDAKRDAAKRTYQGADSLTMPQPNLQTLAQYHSGMFRCDSKHPAPGCTFDTEIDQSLCIGVEDKTATCSRNVFAELKRRDTALAKYLAEATAIKADALQTAEVADLKRISGAFYDHAIGLEGTRGPFYGLYAGPNFLLQDGGDWKEGVEIFASFNTEAFDRQNCPFAWVCRGFFDVTFATPDTFPTEVEDDEQLPIAVFDTKGRVRIRAGGQAHWNEYAGLELGVGVTSPISDQSSSVRGEPRFHIGAHFQTAYADRAIGDAFIGYARDKAWERLVDRDGNLSTTADQVIQERFDRLLFEGTLIFPRLELGGFSLAARLSADLPWSGDTQSELRTSILLYYPLNSWLEKFRPREKPAEPAAP
jgi:hypothetical protein